MKRIQLFILFLIVSSFAIGQTTKLDPKATTQKLAATMFYIENFYVDSTDLPKLTETAIVSMLKELDPHSAYISKEEIDRANEPLIGSFEGIGVSFQLLRDTILIIGVIPDGPSERAGILAGDRIIKIDDEIAFGKKVDNKFVQDRLRGKKGSKVIVSIKRAKEPELADYTIVRDKIPLHSIDATFMLDKEIGYIKLNRFSKTTIEEFHESCKKLADFGMKSLVLDLRGNSGGYLNVAFELSDEFLTKDKLIVYTEGLKSPRQEFISTNKGNFKEGKLIVLIDEGSASASEIVSGAIQDWDRGILVGRRSFGKGLVQRPFNLPDGAVIRLTTAEYYTPSGRCIQKPYEEGVENYYKDLINRQKKGEFVNADSIHFPDSLKYFTNAKRIVYGGGGIMPDIFVPVDTTHFTKYYTDLIRKRVFNDFTVEFANENRMEIKQKYHKFEDFKKKFEITESLKEAFLARAEKEGVEMNKEQYEKSEDFIWLQVKALIARNIWDSEQYYHITTDQDPTVIEAIALLRSKKKYATMLKP
ncbi:MAG: S41 family peptidase [Lentimicrobiaceae bacterium]|jgi:carboxyl-terminal processing protease|nr:S41 family peptidase [Lentimicrobiaceae bacterium]